MVYKDKIKKFKFLICTIILTSIPIHSNANSIFLKKDYVKNNISNNYINLINQNIPFITSGNSHVLAIKEDGSVWSWGLNDEGQLGVGDFNNRDIPTEVTDLNNIKQIIAGEYHTLALKTDGTVWSWGYNYYGQLGLGDSINRTTPTQIVSLNNVKQISSGSGHCIALKEDGTIWSWGYNSKGQLGLGNNTNTKIPVKIEGLDNVKEVVARGYQTMFIKEDGSVWTCGSNNYGQLGLNDTIDRNLPTQIPDFNDVVKLINGISYTFAIKKDNTVWGWGANGTGHLGLGDSGASYSILSPIEISALKSLKLLSAGLYHNLALIEDNVLLSWGANYEGQLGYGDYTNRKNPTKLMNINNIYQLSTGYYHSIMVKNDGTIWTWGWNSDGQLGLGDDTNRSIPTIMKGFKLFKTEVEKIVEKAEQSKEISDIEIARNEVNQLPESEIKNQLHDRLDSIVPNISLDRGNITNNLDIYIKSENSLHMALDTNSVSFEDYSGVDELEKQGAVNITINSSLPYQLNAYLIDEIYNSDKSEKIDMDRLNIKDNLNDTDTNYKEFTAINNKLILNDSCDAGNDIEHTIDLKLKGGEAYPADIYKTTIKFEAEQK